MTRYRDHQKHKASFLSSLEDLQCGQYFGESKWEMGEKNKKYGENGTKGEREKQRRAGWRDNGNPNAERRECEGTVLEKHKEK